MNLVKEALREQYHGALAMLAQCVERCPEDFWTTPNPRNDDGDRVIFRAYWRIVLHAAYFTHLYLGQSDAEFQPPPADLAIKRREDLAEAWHAPWDVEPFELPEHAPPPTKQEVLEYLAFIDSLVDPTVEALDLETMASGIPWYKKIGKLSHQMMNLRHVQGHVGQLSELLMARGIDIDWISKAPR